MKPTMSGPCRRSTSARAAGLLACAAVVGLVIAGCGGSNQAAAIQSSVNAYIMGVAHRDPAEACGAITPAFWAGTEQDINSSLEGVQARLPTLGCLPGLKRYFADVARHRLPTPSVSFRATHVSGDRALTTIVSGGNTRQLQLLKAADDRWRINCCAGQQIAKQPTATYRVPSGSMEPTLKIGQIVTSNNAAMRAHPPALANIIVFHPPAGADPANARCANPHEGIGHRQACDQPTAAESTQTFIKRVVGLPGDRIAIIHGHVIRNGAREPDSYTYQCRTGPDCDFPTPIVIPPGEYFVLGDNRGESDDSRFWGPIKRAWIIGVVVR